MFVKSLKLQNYRSYNLLDLEFHSKLIFFIGENGAGKTNILEAINQFATLKSFRDNSDEELVNWDSDFFYIKTEFEKNQDSTSLEIGYSKNESIKRKVKLNGSLIQKRQEAIGELKTVVFSPSDLIILEGGPSERRRFIDSFISIVNKNYYIEILEYNKVLKQRNALLKKPNLKLEEVLPWNKLLYEKGIQVFEYRKEYIEKLNFYFQTDIERLSGNKDIFQIVYKPNVEDYSTFEQGLINRFRRDIQLGYTTSGIHRDEIFIGREDKDILEFASQGQKRSTVISLKTAQFYITKNETGESPILLIDDVIRELDVKRREFFVELLMNAGQTFFTTTDLEGISEYVGKIEQPKEIFAVEGKSVKRV